mmetsp:Transcript_13992/g.18674  ORF Transcript_13992/g.18674 Transcript_13992/m.18674 type:complete len:964 (+) Transcript_13992:84-2975(+)|eukprot:CAMPEP_0197302856 /NCGR_PEP_ID=MMETSP0890-20130614/51317_1 /TAXON_ID=44058 ORGANISM="Aureoumbra lagunensis, Strain CCMP1510" /NCGR_SAMPLE_ID=MMETSP0890 /ASSEMBLY_ACC=CAM_ASM_000533 /LENGTH=963 /DNA_ID=CAMNT_0042782577 /DNA_START=22 /DNA_END=2913 /DNA_ORIENTATION=-
MASETCIKESPPPAKRQHSANSATSGEKMSSRSVVWRRRRVPAQLPFSLTRCRICKRAKQGAVFCRVVRRHKEDGWISPDGFDDWIEQWESQNTPNESDVDQESSPRQTNIRRASRAIDTKIETAPPETKIVSSVSSGITYRRNTINSLGRSLESRNASLPQMTKDTELIDRSIPVWRPMESIDYTAYLNNVKHVREEDALFTLFQHDYNEDAAISALLNTLESEPNSTQDALTINNQQMSSPIQAASETFLATAAWICEAPDSKITEHPGYNPPPNTLLFGQEDLAKFADTLLDCDRDCRMALKKLRKEESFVDATMAQILELYYARLKPAPQYFEWKQRLNKRRHNLGNDDDLIDPELGDVFNCPCGCGRTVDNRGRSTSHRRKWATRACRDRAARAVSGNETVRNIEEKKKNSNTQPPSPLGVTASNSKACVDRKPNPSTSSFKKAPVAVTTTTNPPEPPSPIQRTSSTGGKQRLALVHGGILLALPTKEGSYIPAQIRCRASKSETWIIDLIDPDCSFGKECTMSTLEIVDAMLTQDFSKCENLSTSQPPRYRGVTCKKYGETSRYNAAFSLLGDRFSLGGFDLAEQAAAAWDVVAWRSGRDDLNILKLPTCTIEPTRDDLKRLAMQLRDNMRLRSLNASHLARIHSLDLDAIDLGTRKLVLGTTKKEEQTPSKDQGADSLSKMDTEEDVITTNEIQKKIPETPTSSKVSCPLGVLQTPPTQQIEPLDTPPMAVPKPSIGEALFGPCFKTDTGAALLLHDVVYVVSVRLSRRWLVERYDADHELAHDFEKKFPPPLLEMSEADVKRAGQKSFILLSRGTIPQNILPSTIASVLRFLSAELIGRPLLDADKKLKPQQRERCVARLKLRTDICAIVADTTPLSATTSSASPAPNATPRRLVDTPNGVDAPSFWKSNSSVEYELEAVRRAIERFAAQPNSPPPRKKLKTPPATPVSTSRSVS